MCEKKSSLCASFTSLVTCRYPRLGYRVTSSNLTPLLFTCTSPLILHLSRLHPITIAMDSPGSPLSSIASDEISDREDAIPSSANTNMPPSKRRRTGLAPQDGNTTPVSITYQDQEDLQPPASPSTSISSDTSGEIPNSPTTLALLGNSQEEDYSGQGSDQVTVCRWEGCDAGDLGNMDDLVGHIHNEHIGSRQKKYSCEWADCNRKGQTHASGYALRAHMRSHTREKPFYCSLPGMLSVYQLACVSG